MLKPAAEDPSDHMSCHLQLGLAGLATQVYDATPRTAHGLRLIPQPVILAPVAKARMKEALVI